MKHILLVVEHYNDYGDYLYSKKENKIYSNTGTIRIFDNSSYILERDDIENPKL